MNLRKNLDTTLLGGQGGSREYIIRGGKLCD